MSSRVFKNTQVNVGIPFQLKVPEIDFIRINENDGKSSDLESGEDLMEESEPDVDLLVQNMLEKAKQDSEELVKDAERKCNEMIMEAEKKAEELMRSTQQEAHIQGYKEGYDKAYGEVIEQSSDILKSIMDIKQKADSEFNEVFKRLESEFVTLALDIARAVIEDELNTDKSKITSIIDGAVRKCSNKESLIIKVSDYDYDFIVNSNERLERYTNGEDSMEIKRDSSIRKGSCIVESKLGIIDAGINTKFEKIRQAFMQMAGTEK